MSYHKSVTWSKKAENRFRGSIKASNMDISMKEYFVHGISPKVRNILELSETFSILRYGYCFDHGSGCLFLSFMRTYTLLKIWFLPKIAKSLHAVK